jgi:hypothetical protein
MKLFELPPRAQLLSFSTRTLDLSIIQRPDGGTHVTHDTPKFFLDIMLCNSRAFGIAQTFLSELPR